MLPLLIALVAFGGVLAYGLHRSRHARGKADVRGGLLRLNDLRWREFERMVAGALQPLGYRDCIGENDSIDRQHLMLERDGERVLMTCKQGAGTIGPQSLHELAQQARLRGAQRAMMVTTGQFDDAARTVAKVQKIELVDGDALWPLASAVLETPAEAAAPDRKPQIVAWLGALAVGAIAWMIAQGLMPEPASVPTAPAATSPRADLPAATPAARPSAAPAAGSQASEPVPTDPAALDRRRRDAVNAVSTLPGVARALWSTRSTLMVHLAREGADPMPGLCPLLERYPELAASRIQLQPPQNSTAPVRFRQCRSY